MKNFYIAVFVVFVSFFFSSCTDNSLDELSESHEKIQIQKIFIDKGEFDDGDEEPQEGES